MTHTRTLPVRLAPHPGEALDSWWEALAHRLGSTTADVLTSLGLLPPGPSSPGVVPGALNGLVTLLEPDQVSALAWASGTDEDALHAMTLARYDQRALLIDRQRRRVVSRYVWGRSRGSRFCPGCLSESGGRWQLRWRLGWSFVCPDHHQLLADTCPRCHRTPRHVAANVRRLLVPGQCHNPVEADPARSRCGHPLEAAEVLPLSPGGPVVRAQAVIDEVISSGQARFGLYQDSPQPALAFFGDLRALASVLLFRTPEDRLGGIVPAGIMALHRQPAGERRWYLGQPVPHLRDGRLAPARAATAAAGLTAALHVLSQSDPRQAGAALRGLITGPGGDIPLKCGHRWRHASPVWDAVQLAALAPRFKHSDQLRFRTHDVMPRRPAPGAASLALRRARKVPSLLWPAWSARLSPPGGAIARTMRPALTCFLVLVGSTSRFGAVSQHLRLGIGELGASKAALRLSSQGCWREIYLALSRLADHLDQIDPPIDYDRRRTLDYTALLPHSAWHGLCRELGFDVGGARRHQFVRALMFERVSGLPVTQAPPAYAPTTSDQRTRLRTFETILTPRLVHGLDALALGFLARQGVRDEPLTWQPPTSLLGGLGLPGFDLDQIDRDALHTLIRVHEMTTAQAAAELRVSHDAVRFVLQDHPAPDSKVCRGESLRTARAALPRDLFVRLFLDEYRPLSWIAAHAGVSVDAIKLLVLEYGLTRDGKAAKSGRIDLRWLRKERAAGRTYRELGAETGLSGAMIGYLARRHGIPGPRSGSGA